MPKVILKGYVIVPEEDLNAVLAELPLHIEKTRAEDGCLIFRVVQDPLQPGRLNVHEEFVDQASFDAHQARVRNSEWGRVSSNIERHYHFEQLGR